MVCRRWMDLACNCVFPTFQSVHDCQATCSMYPGGDGHVCGGGQWCAEHICGSRSERTAGAGALEAHPSGRMACFGIPEGGHAVAV